MPTSVPHDVGTSTRNAQCQQAKTDMEHGIDKVDNNSQTGSTGCMGCTLRPAQLNGALPPLVLEWPCVGELLSLDLQSCHSRLAA